jgi:hypothetical protein
MQDQLRGWGVFICYTCLHAPSSTETFKMCSTEKQMVLENVLQNAHLRGLEMNRNRTASVYWMG